MFLTTTSRRVSVALAKASAATSSQQQHQSIRSLSLLVSRQRVPTSSTAVVLDGLALRNFSQTPSTSLLGRPSWSNLFHNNSKARGGARSFASLTETDIKKRLDGFQDLFVEARLCIEDVTESEGTKYFDEDAEAAQEAVQEAVDAFNKLVAEIEDPNEKNRVLRGNGLKVEQLKGELDLALKGGHDH
jgi:hypothetical protein